MSEQTIIEKEASVPEIALLAPGQLEVIITSDRASLVPERTDHELAGLEAILEISVLGEVQYAGVYVTPLNCRGYYYRYCQKANEIYAPPGTCHYFDEGVTEPADAYSPDFLRYLEATNRLV